MGLADALKRRRSEMGLTLKDIADRLGVSEATVQRYESGNIKQLRHGKISKLAEILEVTPAFLMGFTNNTGGAWDDEITADEMLDVLAEKEEQKRKALAAVQGIELLKAYFLQKKGRPATPEELSDLDRFANHYIKGFDE